MKNNINKIYPYIFSISFVLIITFVSFYFVCFFDKNMLMKLWEKYDVIKYLPFKLSIDDLYKLQNELMSFLKGKLQFLETKVTINGVLTDFYSVRTKVHMGDVRIIFRNYNYLTYISIALCIFSLFKIRTFEKPFYEIKKAYGKVLIVFSLVLISIIIFATCNFDAFFTKFHEILFDNDFWLLNPNEDFIICILPEVIFINIGIKIVLVTFILLIGFYFLYQTLSKIPQSPEAK